MTTRRHALRDDQWQHIEQLLPRRVGTIRVATKKKYLFVEAMHYSYGVGIPWRDLLEHFGCFCGLPIPDPHDLAGFLATDLWCAGCRGR